MSKKKIFAIWSIVTAVLLIGVFFTTGLIMKGISSVIVPQYLKYGPKIGPSLYHPEDVTDDEMGGALKVRSILYDTVIKQPEVEEYEDAGFFERLNKNIEFSNAYVFVCEDREIRNVASGCWSNVFRYDPDKIEDERLGRMELETSFAMFDVEKAINQGYGVELQNAIKEDDDICIGVDKYAVKDMELIPMHVTVQKDGNVVKEYSPNADSDIPEGFEIKQENEVWIYNKKYQGLGEHITEVDLSEIKELERVRAIAMKTAESIDFKNPEINMENDYYQRTEMTPFSVTTVGYGVYPAQEGETLYSLVCVTGINITNFFFEISAITVGIWTILFAIIVFAFRKRKA